MPFINYHQFNQVSLDARMQENVRRLQEFDLFHCLLAGSPKRMAAVKKRFPNLPADFWKWLTVCDGGMLFDTAMLTTKSQDTTLDLSFDTYGDYCDTALRESQNILDDWFIFAVAVHSDVFFFDLRKQDGKVYQWDVAAFSIYAVWDTFEDWLTDQINEALELIANEELEPLDIKLEVDGDA